MLVQFSPQGTRDLLTQPATTDANGQSTATLTSTLPGAKTITAQVIGGPLLAHTLTVTFVPGAAAKFAFTVPPSNVQASATMGPAVQLAVEDALGNVVTSATPLVAMTIGTNPGGGVLSSSLAAAVNGIVSFPALSIDRAGQGYTLTALEGGLASATSAAFDVTALPPAKLAFLVQPSSALAGSTIAPAVQVAIEDALGNLDSSATDTVTLAIGINPVGEAVGCRGRRDCNLSSRAWSKSSSGSRSAARKR